MELLRYFLTFVLLIWHLAGSCLLSGVFRDDEMLNFFALFFKHGMAVFLRVASFLFAPITTATQKEAAGAPAAAAVVAADVDVDFGVAIDKIHDKQKSLSLSSSLLSSSFLCVIYNLM